MLFLRRLVVFGSIFILCCLPTFANGAALEKAEVDALKSIGRTLGKNWNFSDDIDPCSEDRDKSWKDEQPSYGYVNNVTCDCSFNNNTVCHVLHIQLKGQNLSGSLPKDLPNLPFLQEIDLTRNYLNGTIPPSWGNATRLINIALLGNRLTGPIPEQLASLPNLTSLVLESNDFSGNLPPALGNLPKLERLLLASNKFTGEIPETFARLTSLKEFRISDNNFTGRIPEYIFRGWTDIKRIIMEASGLSGPIPSINVTLGNLEYIIISDLNGGEAEAATFPQLNADLPNLKRLILRSCNLIGEIPLSLANFTTIKILDLSFNRLSGEIPDLTSALDLDNLFFNGNNFTGTVPPWILDAGLNIDISYNNYTSTGGISECRRNGLNLFSSISRRTSNSGIVQCLRSQTTCAAQPSHSVYINCGGKSVNFNGINYEADDDPAGPSAFYTSTTNRWVFSSTGLFLNDNHDNDMFVSENTQLPVNGTGDTELYTNARLSPSSLTYYAFCLANASYTVNLHFAEIQFSNDRNYSSLGRRMFDVYIQGKLELKDFNIKEAAGGAGVPIVKSYTVNVTDGTLEIRLRWAGKGTTFIPQRGVYGPFISAISIFDPSKEPCLLLC